MEGTPFEIGKQFSSEASREVSERMLGILDTILTMSITDDQLSDLLQLGHLDSATVFSHGDDVDEVFEVGKVVGVAGVER